MAIGFPTKAVLPTVPRAEIMVAPTGRIRVDEAFIPSIVILFSVFTTQASESSGASTTENHGMSPLQ